MTCCLNPHCTTFHNPDDAQFCLGCGKPLVLRGQYRALKPLGQGGFGRTFLAIATHKKGQSPCVIKQFFPGTQDTATRSKASQLFSQEALRLGGLGQHPHIPDLLAHVEEDGQQYLIQEFIDGPTLGAVLKAKGPLEPGKIVQILRGLLPVLDFIHQRQVIHRDIKPENILYRRMATAGGPAGLVLVDFGAAKVATATALARTATAIGSAGFVAPEQMGGRPVFASDLYSLGVTCVHLLTGTDPFGLFSYGEDRWVWAEQAPQTVDPALAQILDKMIARPLTQRYGSAAEVMADLERMVKARAIAPQSPLPQTLPSDVGIDYSGLQGLLEQAQWHRADAETCRLMLQAMGRADGSFLTFQELAELPCTDLQTLDQLWLTYSEGHLGFGVQLQIWQQQPGGRSPLETWQSFCEQLGWLHYEHSQVGQRLLGGNAQSIWLSQDEVWGKVYGRAIAGLKGEVPPGFLPFFGSLYPGSSRGGRIFLDRLAFCQNSALHR
ncbi:MULTISPECIES: serine/threonine-protein kinase [unclassified Leptolyngbya]|uniref:serine/threonine-protein kinase n=1 Tax=unclassified Leptolyngbya TaxID=2650499 RepID=UPI0016864C23|nr:MULTISPECIES: serine/threonine-protein kinase [unclassified Leptolyngbya]MBD1911874.1 GUN4 domain-containing protein [Leptolyngbya sp. FACHB-8]MBD2156083.1 GUN4 domain-containing protein [Leptolyngbya sp. FACHB-16]